MLGFYCNVFNDNQVNLIVQNFTGEEAESILAGESTAAFITDSIEAAMEHFNIYEDHGILKRHVESELALQVLDVEPEEVDDFREKINAIIQTFDDEAAAENAILYPKWAADKAYTTNEKVRYDNILYKVLQDHTSQAAWTPDAAPSLFARILIPDSNVIPEWEQPDSTNAYMTGDRVMFNGQIYESVIDNNVWSPEAYPAGWQLITE